MKFSFKTFLKVSLCLLLMSMFHLSYAQGKLPEKWKPEMVLSFSYSGGMSYYSFKAEIKEKDSYYKVNNKGKETHYKLVITPKHLEDLLAFLKEKQFDQIKTEHTGPTDDKGTESIFLQWEGGFAGAGESSASEISKESEASYEAICTYVQQLIDKTKKKTKPKKK